MGIPIYTKKASSRKVNAVRGRASSQDGRPLGLFSFSCSSLHYPSLLSLPPPALSPLPFAPLRSLLSPPISHPASRFPFSLSPVSRQVAL